MFCLLVKKVYHVFNAQEIPLYQCPDMVINLYSIEFQRITNNPSFGLPYWQWEEDDWSPFTPEYFGTPSNSAGDAVNVSGLILNPDDWHTICDLTYASPGLNCSKYCRVCNPTNDLAAQRPLQRGGGTTYVPNCVEVMTALAAPAYDAADAEGKYFQNAPRQSFRNRMEGWAIICSAVTCTGSRVHYPICTMIFISG